jgi:hypothetical protein
VRGEHGGFPPDEAEVELSALKGGAAERADGNRRSPRERMLRGGGVLVALALIAGALLYSVRYTASQAPRAQTTPTAAASFLPLTGLGCVRGAAWDPTSRYLAFLGTPDSLCGNGGYTTNVVNVYQARTATLVRQLHPDAALFAALGLPQPLPVTPTPQSPPLYPQLMYDTLSWSPDGRRLAMTFDLDSGGYNPTTGQLQVISGLVLLDADEGNERVLVDRQTGPQAGPAAYTVWDVQEGTVMRVGNAPPPSGAPYDNGNSLPVALSYAWGSGGSLVPGTPLSLGAEPSALALDLVGNPDDRYSFGLWQPGQVQVYAVLLAAQQTPPTYLYLFQSLSLPDDICRVVARWALLRDRSEHRRTAPPRRAAASYARGAERRPARSGGAVAGTRRGAPTGAGARPRTPGQPRVEPATRSCAACLASGW